MAAFFHIIFYFTCSSQLENVSVPQGLQETSVRLHALMVDMENSATVSVLHVRLVYAPK